jgi:hypothetical protein
MLFKENLNEYIKIVKIMNLLLFLRVFVYVYIHFRIWTRFRIRNPRVTDPDPAKVTDPCVSRSTTLHLNPDPHFE